MIIKGQGAAVTCTIMFECAAARAQELQKVAKQLKFEHAHDD